MILDIGIKMRSFPRLIDHCADIAIRIFNFNSNFPVEETDYTSEKKKWGHSRTTADLRSTRRSKERKKERKKKKRPKVSSYKSPFDDKIFNTTAQITHHPVSDLPVRFTLWRSVIHPTDSYNIFFFSFLFSSTVTPMITICYVLCVYTGRIEPDGEQQTMSALIFYELESFSSSFGVRCCQPI